MICALLRGVSTRHYEEVLPEMAATAKVSRSSVSRQAVEGSAVQLRNCRSAARIARSAGDLYRRPMFR